MLTLRIIINIINTKIITNTNIILSKIIIKTIRY